MLARRRAPQMFLALSAAASLQCGSGSDAPRPQVVVYVDTDSPIASESLKDNTKREASVDTVRIEVLGEDFLTLQDGSRDIPAPEEANWPVSFGVDAAKAASNVVRLRIRTFRARNAEARTNSVTQAQEYEPIAGYTIDRVVEIPLPVRGSFAFRVVLRSECRGKHVDFVHRKTCVDGARQQASYRDGIEILPLESGLNSSAAPARPKPWWPASSNDCPESGDDQKACVPGGFFILGNLRIVGFGAVKRSDAMPAHPVVMKPFRIDRNEVTIGRYREKSNSVIYYGDSCKKDAPAEGDRFPLGCVSWQEAQDFCASEGGRLPTEAEWEYLATGRGRGYLFPWGDLPPTCDSASVDRAASIGGFARCPLGKEDVGSHAYNELFPFGGTIPRDELRELIPDPTGKEPPGPSVSRVFDLAGSMSEWMLDDFKGYDQGANCWESDSLRSHPVCFSGSTTGPEDPQLNTTKSVRGGSWAFPMVVAYSALRDARPPLDSNREPTRDKSIGFRCVYPVGTQDPLLSGTNAKDYERFLAPSSGSLDPAGDAGSGEPSPGSW